MVFPVQQQSPAGALIGEGIADIFGIREKQQEQERLQQVLDNPNASALQKALAFKDNPQMAKLIIQEQRRSALADAFRRASGLPEGIAQAGMTPSIAPAGVQPSRAQTPEEEDASLQSTINRIPDESLVAIAQEFPEAMQEIKLELDQRNKKRELEQKRTIEQEKKEERVYERTEPYVNTVLDAYKGTKTTDAVLGQMMNLSEKGNLTSPLMSQLLGKMGVSIGILNNPDSEEFDKLSNNLTRDIQKFYGSRILQTEFQNFLRQIPTLNNSPEGRKRIIENMQKMLLPPVLEYQAMREIIQENDGKRPRNLKEQVIERIEPQLDAWAAEFKQDLGQKSAEKSNLEGKVVIITPTGQKKLIPREKLEEAKSQGAIPL